MFRPSSYTDAERKLLHGAKTGKLHLIAEGLDEGAAIETLDQHSDTALMAAAQSEQVAAILLLISRGADVNAKRERFSTTALHYALCTPCLDASKALIEGGADVNALNCHKETPLFHAYESAQ